MNRKLAIKSDSKIQNKFKIEFNKELKAKHDATFCDNEEISNQNIFNSIACYFNFHCDHVEFSFEVKNNTWSELTFVTKKVSYEKIDSSSYKSFTRTLRIFNDAKIKESDVVAVTIHAGFKNVLLNLFSPHNKEFKLTIDYVMAEKKYQTVFVVKIPNIEQEDWYPAVSKTDLYRPETIEGKALVKLFRKGFKLTNNSEKQEQELRCEFLDYGNASTTQRFKSFNFLTMFKRMLALEDLFNLKQMEDFSLSHQKVAHFQVCRFSLREAIESQLKFIMCQAKMKTFLCRTFVIEAMTKMPGDVQGFDHIYLTDMADYQQYYDDLYEIIEHRMTGKIYYIFGNVILFQLVYKNRRQLNEVQNEIQEDRPYHVEFLPNRMTVRVAHRAVDDAIKNQLSNYLVDLTASKVVEHLKDKKIIKKFEWMNDSIQGNKEQQVAVRNIVNCTSSPSPYVIFGPPGTGKSTTIIEAIAQIVKLKPYSHILVTARSNTSCDDLANRLLKFVSINKILRIYSPSFDKKSDKIDTNLEKISNFRNRHLCACKKRSCPETEPCDDPTYEEFYTSRVIIATLVSCGRIISAGVKSNHFDYIFIDEAASESEQYTLIPISGLGSSLNGVTAQIVLSGDHCQLGPIVRERFCRKLGMEKSLMERLMQTNPKYQRSPKYNHQFVTQLVKNYRSHPAILEFSNINFYESQLVAKCPRNIANIACGWDFLLYNKEFPLIFHTSRTPSSEVGLSLKNEGEIRLLENYIRVLVVHGINGHKVEESDIGVISPYRAQRDRIIEDFQSEFPKIEIGTVDAFQGREKKFIIMSTVRSHTKHVGFLRNEKRLNVALTRARCLLIIIGNSATLQRCQIWNKFIAYCYKNRAIVGDALSLNKSIVNDDKFEGNEEKPQECEDEFD